jgi:hypothetical protein
MVYLCRRRYRRHDVNICAVPVGKRFGTDGAIVLSRTRAIATGPTRSSGSRGGAASNDPAKRLQLGQGEQTVVDEHLSCWSGLAHHSVVEFNDLLIQSVGAKIGRTTGISVLKSFGTGAYARVARLLATGRDLNYSLPTNSVSS